MTSLLNIGTRSLAAAQGALSTISHNIANVNTAGYSRQTRCCPPRPVSSPVLVFLAGVWT